MGSILGSRQKSSQSSTSTGQGSSESIQTSKSSSRAGLSAQEVLDQFNKTSGQYSKESALGDVSGVLRAQAIGALQEAMPGISKQTNNAGAYDSTTKQLLTNDAEARITGQLAQTGLNAITQYANINNQNLDSLGNLARNTGYSDSSSAGLSKSQYDQSSTGSGSSKGGSGLFGLFADGGEVDSGGFDMGGEAMKMFMDGSGLSRDIMDIKDLSSAAKKMMSGEWKEGAKQFAGTGALSQDDKQALQAIGSAMNAWDKYQESKKVGDSSSTSKDLQFSNTFSANNIVPFFADGGVVGEDTDTPAELLKDYKTQGQATPVNTLPFAEVLLKAMRKYADGGVIDNTPNYGAANAAPAMPTFVFNIGTGAAPRPPADEGMQMLGEMMPKDPTGSSDPAPTAGGTPTDAMGEGAAAEAAIAAVLADGGKVPTKNSQRSSTPEEELLAAIHKYKNGGDIRSGESDVQAGGKIRGKQSPTGEDNQVIGVAGGEGIIPKDVMEVKGVPEMLQRLIQQYHTPVNK